MKENKYKDQYLKALQSQSYWRLFVDGVRQIAFKNEGADGEYRYGPMKWLEREPNSLIKLRDAAQWVFEKNIEHSLSLEFIEELHSRLFPFKDHLKVNHTYRLVGERKFGVIQNQSMLEDVISRAKKLQGESGLNDLPWTVTMEEGHAGLASSLSYFERSKYYNIALAQYQHKMEMTVKEEEKLKNIISFVRTVEDLHLFADGNARMVYLLLNKELVKNGMKPTILLNPNDFDCEILDTLIKEVERGQNAFDYFLKNDKPYKEALDDASILNNVIGEGPKASQGLNYSVVSDICDDFLGALDTIFNGIIVQEKKQNLSDNKLSLTFNEFEKNYHEAICREFLAYRFYKYCMQQKHTKEDTVTLNEFIIQGRSLVYFMLLQKTVNNQEILKDDLEFYSNIFDSGFVKIYAISKLWGNADIDKADIDEMCLTPINIKNFYKDYLQEVKDMAEQESKIDLKELILSEHFSDIDLSGQLTDVECGDEEF